MIVTAETDAEAEAKWTLYKQGADLEALAWMVKQATADTRAGSDSGVHHAIDAASMVNLNIGLLVGSHATVARMLDEVAAIPGLAGVLLTFDEFVSGTETFGQHIQPLMHSRSSLAHAPSPPRSGGEGGAHCEAMGG
jgi:pyrimidine oxygenase